jgi:hypothetical protein
MTSSADRPPRITRGAGRTGTSDQRIMGSLVARMFGDQNLIDDVARRAMSFGSRRVLERLGITPDEMNGGHCVALSRPKELAGRLDSYLS